MDASLLTLFWEDFELVCYESLGANGLLIKLKLTASHPPCCSRCGQSTWLIHDVSYRRVRERDLFQYRVWLDIPVRRVRRPACGPDESVLPG